MNVNLHRDCISPTYPPVAHSYKNLVECPSTLLNNLADLIDDGKLKTTLNERLEPINAANLRLAHEKLETGRSIGKIVLENF